MYHDSNRDPWKLDKRWEDLSPKEWVEVYDLFGSYLWPLMKSVLLLYINIVTFLDLISDIVFIALLDFPRWH